eukprot:3533180-Prymnesium_polylepis.1
MPSRLRKLEPRLRSRRRCCAPPASAIRLPRSTWWSASARASAWVPQTRRRGASARPSQSTSVNRPARACTSAAMRVS